MGQCSKEIVVCVRFASFAVVCYKSSKTIDCCKSSFEHNEWYYSGDRIGLNENVELHDFKVRQWSGEKP